MLNVGIFLPAAVGGAIALAAADLLVQRQKAQAELEASPWSYIMKLGNELK